MGTDCEVHIEIKIEGVWHHYRHIEQLPRLYSFFGLMAGVRGYPTLVKPKGVPEDMTVVTKSNYDEFGYDDHTHSWLSSKEIIDVGEQQKEKLEAFFGLLFGSDWEDFYTHRSMYPDFLEDFRFIFWFNC